MSSWKNPRTEKAIHEAYALLVRDQRDDMHTITPLTTQMNLHATLPSRRTYVMSILNTTPDSFSDGGSNALDPQSLRETASAHIAAGATIIDVGGQSSRPNAPDVTADEEISRVLPAIAAIKSLPEATGIAISVDTYRATVAEAAVKAGAHIVNDISAGYLDPQMLPTVARLGCTYIMMHMRGTPATMQNPENCTYGDGVVSTVKKEMYGRIVLAIEAGIRKWRIITDPGIGFAKTQDQNIMLLRRPKLCHAQEAGFITKTLRKMPCLVGTSRKGFIGSITGVTEPRDRIWGTAAAVTCSVQKGADIVRVHDVKEMAQVAKMADAIYRGPENRH